MLAAAAATLLLGFTTTFQDGKAERTRPRIVDPTSLEALPGSPRFPKDARVDVAPDGRRAAAVASGRLSLYDLRSGRRTARLRVTGGYSVSWMASRRILVIGCRNPPEARAECSPFVTAVDARRPRALRTTRLRGFSQPTFDRVGRHQVLVANRAAAYRAFVFTASGRLVRRLPLPRGAGTIIDGFITAGGTLMAVRSDGRLRRRRIRHVEGAIRTSADTAMARIHEPRGYSYRELDPRTLEPGRVLLEDPDNIARYTRLGWLRQDARQDPRRLTLTGFDGAQRWSVEVAAFQTGVIGDRIYVQDCSGPTLHVYDLADGGELAAASGYRGLEAPTRGSWHPPSYSGDAVSPQFTGLPCPDQR